MKRKLLYNLTLVSILAFLTIPFLVSGAPASGTGGGVGGFGSPSLPAGTGPARPGSTGSGDLDIPAIINRIATWLFNILMAVAVVMILVAAFMHVSSGGNEEKVRTANKMIVYAVIGVAIALLSKVLISLVQYFVGR